MFNSLNLVSILLTRCLSPYSTATSYWHSLEAFQCFLQDGREPYCPIIFDCYVPSSPWFRDEDNHRFLPFRWSMSSGYSSPEQTRQRSEHHSQALPKNHHVDVIRPRRLIWLKRADHSSDLLVAPLPSPPSFFPHTWGGHFPWSLL